MTTLSTMGPSYKISFELFVNSFTGVDLQHGTYAEVLRFTCTNQDCCSPGDRIPLVMTHKDSGDAGRITVTTQIGDNGNYYGLWNIKRRSWTSVETRLGVDKVKPKGWFQVVGTILKLSYFLNFFVGQLLHG